MNKDVINLNPLYLDAVAVETDVVDEIAKRATIFARFAMADVEFALRELGTQMSNEEYTKVFRAMMQRKAANELRKANA